MARSAPPDIVRSAYAELIVTDLGASKHFWVDRLGFVISAEIIFGMPDQKLTIRHDSGNTARPDVDGALLAIRKLATLVGVHRGLDSVLDL